MKSDGALFRTPSDVFEKLQFVRIGRQITFLYDVVGAAILDATQEVESAAIIGLCTDGGSVSFKVFAACEDNVFRFLKLYFDKIIYFFHLFTSFGHSSEKIGSSTAITLSAME